MPTYSIRNTQTGETLDDAVEGKTPEAALANAYASLRDESLRAYPRGALAVVAETGPTESERENAEIDARGTR